MTRIDTQREQIRARLLNGKSVTPLEALNLFGCFRLAAQICDLKKQEGLPIITEIVHDEATGKRYAKYFIDKKYFTPTQLKIF